jgi:hypothetical protein
MIFFIFIFSSLCATYNLNIQQKIPSSNKAPFIKRSFYPSSYSYLKHGISLPSKYPKLGYGYLVDVFYNKDGIFTMKYEHLHKSKKKSTFSGRKKIFYKNKQLAITVPFFNGLISGTVNTYYKNGSISSSRKFTNSYRSGVSSFYSNNSLLHSLSYSFDTLNGLSSITLGRKKYSVLFKKNKIISISSSNKSIPVSPFISKKINSIISSNFLNFFDI